MENLQNRHDLTDDQRLKIEPIIKGRVETGVASTLTPMIMIMIIVLL